MNYLQREMGMETATAIPCFCWDTQEEYLSACEDGRFWEKHHLPTCPFSDEYIDTDGPPARVRAEKHWTSGGVGRKPRRHWLESRATIRLGSIPLAA